MSWAGKGGRGAFPGGHNDSLDEQGPRRLTPIASVDDLACDGIFKTDEELDAFFTHTYTYTYSRRGSHLA